MSELLTLWQSAFVRRAVTALVAVLVMLLLARVLRNAVTARVSDAGLRYRARKLISFAAWLTIVVVAGSIFSDKLQALALSLGVVGAGIAFALQEVIASVAGRIAIAFVKFYDVGDRVQLGGIKGDVIDIGTLRTTLMEIGDWVHGDLYTGRIVRVANSFVFKEPVFNYSADFPFLWDQIRVPVRHGSDHRAAREILERAVHAVVGGDVEESRKTWATVVKKYRIENARVEPMVTLIATDNWLEFTVRYVVDYTRRRRVKDQLFSLLLDEFAQSGGKVQLASATYELVGAPELRLRMQRDD